MKIFDQSVVYFLSVNGPSPSNRMGCENTGVVHVQCSICNNWLNFEYLDIKLSGLFGYQVIRAIKFSVPMDN